MKVLTAISLATLAGFASAASAGGLAQPVAGGATEFIFGIPADAVDDWTGSYIGLQIGRGTIDGAQDLDVTTYGAHAGYLRDLGTYVVGVEIDNDRARIEDEPTDGNRVTRLKAIVGYDAGKFMPYAVAGLANLRVEDGIGGVFDNRGSVFGAGVAYKVNSRIRVGAEVLRHDFNDINDTTGDVDVTTFAVKASYSF